VVLLLLSLLLKSALELFAVYAAVHLLTEKLQNLTVIFHVVGEQLTYLLDVVINS
jgi:hypothetical protein